MRRIDERDALIEAFRAGAKRFGFRLVHYAILTNHLHFIVEAKDRQALSRGMQGLLIRIARRLNNESTGRAPFTISLLATHLDAHPDQTTVKSTYAQPKLRNRLSALASLGRNARMKCSRRAIRA